MRRLPRVSLLLAFAALASLLPSYAIAADASEDMKHVNPDEIKWGAAPPSLPKGAKAAMLDGDPGKSGAFTVRLSMPAGYKVPPHWHSHDENVTVISGTLYLGAGDALETDKAHAVKAGGFHHIPAKIHHYAFAKGPAIIQIQSEGPFDINYIRPDDDPRASAKK